MQHKKNGGFSLIEVVLAIAILVVCSLPIISAFLSSRQTNAEARQSLNATTAAQNVMESAKARGVTSLLTDPDAAYTVTDMGADRYEIEYNDYLLDGDTYQIKMKIKPSDVKVKGEDGSEEAINGQELIDVPVMSPKTDAVYTQQPNELWQVAKEYAEVNSLETADVVADARTTYKFTVTSENGVDVVEAEVIYETSDGTKLRTGDHSTKLYDSVQADGELKNLYIYYIPTANNPSSIRDKIIIENDDDKEFQVFLFQQAEEDYEPPVNFYITEGSGVSFRTNMKMSNITFDGDELKSKIPVSEGSASVRLYDIEVVVYNRDGTSKLATIKGTAIK